MFCNKKQVFFVDFKGKFKKPLQYADFFAVLKCSFVIPVNDAAFLMRLVNRDRMSSFAVPMNDAASLMRLVNGDTKLQLLNGAVALVAAPFGAE